MRRSAVSFFLLMLPALWLAGGAGAAEIQPGQAGAEAAAPTLDSVGLSAGYLHVGIDGGGETLMPYSEPDSDFRAGFDFVHYFPWQGTAGLDAAWEGGSYFDVDGFFNYRGDVDLTFNSTRYPRNFEHLTLPPETSSYFPDDRDPGDRYRLDLFESSASLKVRAPSYPAHARLRIREYEANGHRQQLFLDRNCVSECHNVSQTRKMDKRTTQAELGGDAHLGYLDASYTFKSLSFKESEPDPTWNYGPLFGYRDPGPRVHNIIPEVSAREHQLTLSTSNTGRISATAGLAMGQRENEDAGLAKEYLAGSGVLTFTPVSRVSVALKYNHYESDDADISAGARSLRNAAGLPVSFPSERDVWTAVVRYAPMKGLRFRGDWVRKVEEREKGEEARVPEKNTTDTLKFSGQYKPLRNLTFGAYYKDEQADEATYSITLVDRQEWSLSMDWQPSPVVMLRAQYLSSQGDNQTSRERDEDKARFHAGATLAMPNQVTLSLFFTMFDNDVNLNPRLVRDEAFENQDLLRAPGSVYGAQGSQVTLQAGWKPLERLEVTAGVVHLQAEGKLSIRNNAGFADIGDFSRFDARQRDYSLGIAYRFDRGWGLSVHGAYLTYDDRADPAGNEIARTVVTMVSKRW